MTRSPPGGLLLAACVFAATTAQASVPGQPAMELEAALQRLQRAANIELLFDPALMVGRRAPAMTQAATPGEALERLLAGSGLVARRTAGAYVIVAAPVRAPAVSFDPPQAAPVVAELLVVGRRTLNADIRRDIDDIQPYQISNSDDIARASPDTPEDFLRRRLSVNTTSVALTQQPVTGAASARSQVDIRGLGSSETLVLIDGRRLPSVPANGNFLQADLNGLGATSIDRIESLAGSAGGIFGLGAFGGVVNIILKRDFEGAEARATGGVSTRGDAPSAQVSGRIGHAFNAGRSNLMIAFSASGDDGLGLGDRGTFLEARRLRFSRSTSATFAPASNSLNVISASGNLTLIPALGGTALNARTTTLAGGALPVDAAGAAALAANAGQLDLSLPADGQGAGQSLLTRTRSASVFATFRQKLSFGVEAFLDVVGYQDKGQALDAYYDTSLLKLYPGGSNPFQQTVYVSFPTQLKSGQLSTRTRTGRAMAGLIARLPRGWTANVDAAIGRATVDSVSASGLAASANSIVVLGKFSTTSATLPAQTIALNQSSARNTLVDFNARLAGSLLRLPGGPLDLTITAESRLDRNPGEMQVFDGPGVHVEGRQAGQRESVSSLFAEARAPLTSRDGGLGPLHGLELQAAVRYDRYAVNVPSGFSAPSGPYIRKATATPAEETTQAVGSITFGARAWLGEAVMLRSSIASGYRPPDASQIIPSQGYGSSDAVVDPKRKGEQPDPGAIFTTTTGGSPTLRPQRSQTFSVGVVYQPPATPGLRVSVDYSAMKVSNEITTFANGDFQYFVDHEGLYPGRVVRGPLTTQDQALGYTGGPILTVDTSALNVGRSSIRAVDVAADYRFDTRLGGVHAYLRSTWEPVFRRRGDPEKSSYNLAGHADGPLKLRGNGGIDWTRGSWSLGLNAQVYGPYSLTYATPGMAALYNADIQVQQPGARVPAQAYLDGVAVYRPVGRWLGASPEWRLTIRNLLDRRPPTVIPATPGAHESLGYSVYGDVRGRLVEISLAARF